MKIVMMWLGRAVAALLVLSVGLAAVLAAAGLVYQAISTANDERRYPPPGQRVDVGGYRMHIHCVGTATAGSPTVVLEAGQGNSSSIWAWVQAEVAKTTHVCAYDRAGAGWSDASPNPRDAAHMADELHALLGKAGITGPVVLAGHSFGGLVTHVYAARYPKEVAGLVWVDVEQPDQWTRLPEQQAEHTRLLQLAALGRWVAPFGLVRLSNFFPRVNDLPPQEADEFKAWTDTTRFMTINAAEFAGQDQSLPQARAAGSLGSLPLIVLTATDHGFPKESSGKLEHDWLQAQNELAGLSTNSVHRVLPGTTHGSLLTNQNDARHTSDAIVDIVKAVRAGQHLT